MHLKISPLENGVYFVSYAMCEIRNIYIYIYIYRERERERVLLVFIFMPAQQKLICITCIAFYNDVSVAIFVDYGVVY